MKITLEKIERETDKAVLAAIEIETCAGRRGVKVWWPKSQVAIAAGALEAPAWLVEKKLAEIAGGRRIPGGIWFN